MHCSWSVTACYGSPEADPFCWLQLYVPLDPCWAVGVWAYASSVLASFIIRATLRISDAPRCAEAGLAELVAAWRFASLLTTCFAIRRKRLTVYVRRGVLPHTADFRALEYKASMIKAHHFYTICDAFCSCHILVRKHNLMCCKGIGAGCVVRVQPNLSLAPASSVR